MCIILMLTISIRVKMESISMITVYGLQRSYILFLDKCKITLIQRVVIHYQHFKGAYLKFGWILDLIRNKIQILTYDTWILQSGIDVNMRYR